MELCQFSQERYCLEAEGGWKHDRCAPSGSILSPIEQTVNDGIMVAYVHKALL